MSLSKGLLKDILINEYNYMYCNENMYNQYILWIRQMYAQEDIIISFHPFLKHTVYAVVN